MQDIFYHTVRVQPQRAMCIVRQFNHRTSNVRHMFYLISEDKRIQFHGFASGRTMVSLPAWYQLYVHNLHPPEPPMMLSYAGSPSAIVEPNRRHGYSTNMQVLPPHVYALPNANQAESSSRPQSSAGRKTQ